MNMEMPEEQPKEREINEAREVTPMFARAQALTHPDNAKKYIEDELARTPHNDWVTSYRGLLSSMAAGVEFEREAGGMESAAAERALAKIKQLADTAEGFYSVSGEKRLLPPNLEARLLNALLTVLE